MICPEHNREVEDCLCQVAEDLMTLAGKQMSDRISRKEADEIALRLYQEEKGRGSTRPLFSQ